MSTDVYIDELNENGEYVLRKIIENPIKNKEGFERYQGLISMKKENISSDKISFLKLFEKWNWIIGSGFYLEDMYKEIKKRLWINQIKKLQKRLC